MRRGWCPTLFDPMPTGDGLLVRVKPPGSRLTAAAAQTLADAAERHGNGIIELTGRGNLQVRGLSAASVPLFAAAMVAAGLASADPAAEARRTVLCAPLAAADPTAAPDALALALAIEAMLAATPTQLASKFGVAVDGGGVLPLAVDADIVVRTDGRIHCVEAGGGMPKRMPPFETVDAIRRIAMASGGQRLRRVGCALELHQPPVGPIPHAFGFGLPFGQTDAAALRTLAAFAETGDGLLRLTPWRAILLHGVMSHPLPGFITDTADPRLRAAACIGSAGCASGTVAARADAAWLARLDLPGTLHVSGCAKGCAHPGPAATTLTGDAGRYTLARHGVPIAAGLTREQAAALL